MASSIEFGVLKDSSTISLIPDYRVAMGQDEYMGLRPTLDRISGRTGIEFDPYSSAQVADAALDVFIEEMASGARVVNDDLRTLMAELVRAAYHAKQSGKPLQYRGL